MEYFKLSIMDMLFSSFSKSSILTLREAGGDMEEKRRTTRRYLLYYMRVYDVSTRQQIGNLVDITPRGIMVVSDHEIEVGQVSRLKMELTAEVAEKSFMEFSVKSKWCKPDINPHMFNTGFEILDLQPDDAKIILRIVDEFGFRDNKPSA
jgi:hypothetical protein